MDKEHVRGAADNVAGKAKEVAGHVTGNRKLETEGKVEQVKGAPECSGQCEGRRERGD